MSQAMESFTRFDAFAGSHESVCLRTDTETSRRRSGREERTSEVAEWYPAADVYEKDGEYEIAVDLPGIDRSALEISIDDNRYPSRESASLRASASPNGTAREAGL